MLFGNNLAGGKVVVPQVSIELLPFDENNELASRFPSAFPGVQLLGSM